MKTRKKKILMLGGAYTQIPAIKKAVEMGFYTITCDYLPNNPGHQFAHEYHNVSTTDKEAVLALAKQLNIDGIVCYASDPSATTAAYVCDRLGFPTSPYESVEILANKDKFRHFLHTNGFNVPKAKGYDNMQKALDEITEFSLPAVVKPVDSSASKGVTILHDVSKLKEAIEYALSFSRAKRFIIEEFIEKVGYQLGGDGFSVNGELVFKCFSNSHTYAINPIVPFGESFPYILPDAVQTKIHNDFQRALTLLNMKTGAYNLEARLNGNGDIFILEIGPRNGGTCIPQVIRYATGVDMVEYTIKAAMGMDCSDLCPVAPTGFWAAYEVHSTESGILKEIWIEENFRKNNIVEFEAFHKKGDKIEPAYHEGAISGIMILKFASREEMLDKMDNIYRWVKIIV